jgi:hypothetical protein
MKKTAVLLLALAVLLLGCVSPQAGPVIIGNNTGGEMEKNETGQVKINATGDCPDLLDSVMRDNCYLNKVTTGALKDVSICYKISDDKLRDRCIYMLALENIELCPQISAASINLRDDCFYAHAESTGMESTCFRIRDPELLKKCQGAIAQKLCGGLGDYEKTLCLAIKTQTPALCANDVNHSQDCYFDVAMNLSDTSACGKLENQATRRACEVIITKNYGLCDMFEFNTSSDACYKLVAVELDNYTLCDKTVTATYINDCHEALAIQDNAPSLCGDMVSELRRNQCYANVASKHISPEVCAKITEPGIRDRCRLEIAKATVDPSVCSLVENNYQRNYQCFSQIISMKEYPLNVDACSRITADFLQWRDECLVRVAQETGNLTICGLIQTEAVKSRCS